MTLALALAGGRYRMCCRQPPRGAWAGDPRALALSYGTRQLLESLGAWNGTAATPIETIHVSQRGGFGRTLIDAADYGIPALGYVMRYRDLAATLDARIDAVHDSNNSAISEVKAGSAAAEILLAARCDGDHATHRCSTRRPCRRHSRQRRRRHGCTITGSTPWSPRSARSPGHAQRAWERFTPDGPLALLPLGAGLLGGVHGAAGKGRSQLLRSTTMAFLAALRAQFGGRVDFTASGPRASFPLALRVRQQLTATRQVWIGNAAQSLHPVSGQGFNLGLRDAWELAADAARQRQRATPAMHATLATYARAAAVDRRRQHGVYRWPGARLFQRPGATAVRARPGSADPRPACRRYATSSPDA
jgi:2-octaprenyl-6-methoxyphenol hydroxylase